MPIYEYACEECGHEFEKLVRGQARPECPECGSQELERLLSLPTVQSETTKEMALRSAKKREARRAEQKARAQREYELAHDDH